MNTITYYSPVTSLTNATEVETVIDLPPQIKDATLIAAGIIIAGTGVSASYYRMAFDRTQQDEVSRPDPFGIQLGDGWIRSPPDLGGTGATSVGRLVWEGKLPVPLSINFHRWSVRTTWFNRNNETPNVRHFCVLSLGGP